MTSRKKSGVALWAIVALVVVLVGYPLSFGPACWLASHADSGGDFVSAIYQPFLRVYMKGPPGIQDVARWYVNLAATDDWCVVRGATGDRWCKCPEPLQ